MDRKFTGITDPADIRLVLHVLAEYSADGLTKAEALCQARYRALDELDRRYERDRADALTRVADAEQQLRDEVKAIWTSEVDRIASGDIKLPGLDAPSPEQLADEFMKPHPFAPTRCPNGGSKFCALENCPGPHFLDSKDDRN